MGPPPSPPARGTSGTLSCLAHFHLVWAAVTLSSRGQAWMTRMSLQQHIFCMRCNGWMGAGSPSCQTVEKQPCLGTPDLRYSGCGPYPNAQSNKIRSQGHKRSLQHQYIKGSPTCHSPSQACHTVHSYAASWVIVELGLQQTQPVLYHLARRGRPIIKGPVLQRKRPEDLL